MTRELRQNEKLRRVLLLTLCFFVFLFVLRAKTEVYNGGSPVKVTPSTASKLWLSGQKMEIKSVDSSTGVLFWMALLLLVGLALQREPNLQQVALVPAPTRSSLRQLHRFMRPPPSLS